jgi:hypothetical protein
MPPHRHLVVDVTVTSARTSTNVPRSGARLLLPDSLALGAQQGKIDANLRTSALLGTPSVESVYDYYPFTQEDGGWLAPMAAELVDRLAILVVVSRFPGMGVADSRSFRFDSHVRMRHFFVHILILLFGVFGGMCGVSLCNVFLLLFMVLWGPISAMLCRRAVLMLWHAFLFLGLMFFSRFFFLLGGLCCLFL